LEKARGERGVVHDHAENVEVGSVQDVGSLCEYVEEESACVANCGYVENLPGGAEGGENSPLQSDLNVESSWRAGCEGS
jgi:hypothetical protein